MAEHRIHRRVSFRTEVWRGEDGIFSRGNERLGDLSVDGAYIQGAGSSIGTNLNLRFKLLVGNEFIPCTAIARHTGGGGLGVEFLDLSPDNLKRLAAFVNASASATV